MVGFGGPGDIEIPVDADPLVRSLLIPPTLQILGERVAETHGFDTAAPRRFNKVLILG